MALGDEEGPCAMHLRTKHSSTKHQAPPATEPRWALVGACAGIRACRRLGASVQTEAGTVLTFSRARGPLFKLASEDYCCGWR